MIVICIVLVVLFIAREIMHNNNAKKIDKLWDEQNKRHERDIEISNLEVEKYKQRFDEIEEEMRIREEFVQFKQEIITPQMSRETPIKINKTKQEHINSSIYELRYLYLEPLYVSFALRDNDMWEERDIINRLKQEMAEHLRGLIISTKAEVE